MKRRTFAAAGVLAPFTATSVTAVMAGAARAQTAATAPPPAAPAARRAPPPMGPVVGGFTTLHWEHLVPADWDPFKEMKGLSSGMSLSQLDDGDPRAVQMLQQMREVWDNAPANPALAGMAVRLPGFVVPLEDGKDGLKEFLLVPYFGACVHSPPPPANQIVHVLTKTPAKGVRSMDAVWISGRMKLEKTDSYMGMAGYRIEADTVAPYVADKPAAR
jgi:hypothetical protein